MISVRKLERFSKGRHQDISGSVNCPDNSRYPYVDPKQIQEKINEA